MEKLYSLINRLIDLCISNELITDRDRIYTRNQLLSVFGEDSYVETPATNGDLYETLDELIQIAIKKGLVSDTSAQKDIFSSKLMNIFLPLPSQVERHFWELYKTAPQDATNYIYKMDQASNYIKMDRINKNISFHTPSKYGNLDITINLSKPEKDPKDIAAKRNLSSTNYPCCLLCVENEGYVGRSDHPDRSNHRTISMSLNHKDWMLQYSPYLYYNEHCILLSQKHEPMSLTKNSFGNLIDFVKHFPHYFIGSNADLPIVGGSILAHEHYQGGHYTFPLHRAKVIKTFKLEQFPEVDCSLLYWPLSTISLCSQDPEALIECTNYIYEKWQVYSDEEANIIASTNGTRHNTITPVARKIGDHFIMDVVLRNNRTTEDYPLGIFHPHEASWHIKKENIGLIEVMGLAILPARLKEELEAVKNYVLGKSENVPDCHKPWADQLKQNYDGSDIQTYIEIAVGQKFTTVLEDAGVFKTSEEGLSYFNRFINHLGIK